MKHFNTRQAFFMCSSTSDVEERTKILQFLRFLDESGVSEILEKVKPTERPTGGRPEVNRYDLFATILYGFAFGSGTLRDLEDACKYDLRYIYLMRNEQPSHTVFGNFINDYILPNTEEIFSCLMNQIAETCKLDFEDVFIDGSKIEADANKYKFVWKPTTYHVKLCDKIRDLLRESDLDRGIPDKGIFSSSLIARKLTDLSKLIFHSSQPAYLQIFRLGQSS